MLTISRVQLLDLIDSNPAFVTELATAGCITCSQREHIINILQPRDRNGKLLEFLTRRSVAHYQKFISILAKKQARLLRLLTTGGGEVFYI